MDQAWPAYVIVPLVLIGFALFWSFVLYLVALAGWKKLADHYGYDSDFPSGGEQVSFASGLVGGKMPARYGGALCVAPRPDGLYVRTLLPFRPGHPPLRFPWRDMERVDKGGSGMTSHNQFTLNGTRAMIGFRGKAADAVNQAWERYK